MAVLSISALRLVGATTYWPECSCLLRRINDCAATNDFAVCNPILLAVLDQVRLCLRLGSLSKVVIFISSTVIAERALYSASPASCPSSGYRRSISAPAMPRRKTIFFIDIALRRCQRWNNVITTLHGQLAGRAEKRDELASPHIVVLKSRTTP